VTSPALSLEDLRGRGTCTVAEAAAVLQISRGLAYESVRRGDLPALHLGHRFVVLVPRLLALLGDDGPVPRGTPEEGAPDELAQRSRPKGGQPESGVDKFELIQLLKAELAAEQAWIAGGQEGTRPATPNLDAARAKAEAAR
jgi:hypothetical protein